jgi:hypothetical protein
MAKAQSPAACAWRLMYEQVTMDAPLGSPMYSVSDSILTTLPLGQVMLADTM